VDWAKVLSLGPAYVAKRVRVERTDVNALTDSGCLVGTIMTPPFRKDITMPISKHLDPFSW